MQSAVHVRLLQVPFGDWLTVQQPVWVNWTSLNFDISDTSSGTIAIQVRTLAPSGHKAVFWEA